MHHQSRTFYWFWLNLSILSDFLCSLSQILTFRMATKSEGIQRLLQAEQRANAKVAEAKKSEFVCIFHYNFELILSRIWYNSRAQASNIQDMF